MTIAAFRTMAKGVLVVSSAGNKGPDLSSVSNDVPWHLTVGAGSVDRKIVGYIMLENGDLVEGEVLVQGVNSNILPPALPWRGCPTLFQHKLLTLRDSTLSFAIMQATWLAMTPGPLWSKITTTEARRKW